MALDGFQRSQPQILKSEGGLVDHPKDPGGRTNQGVTQRVYDAYRKGLALPMRPVDLITSVERDLIYRRQYWDAVRGDDLPAGVDYVVYDGAVNSGPSQSIKWLQRALGVRSIDGVIGAVTLAALANVANHDGLIRDICDQRIAFLRALKTWKTFGRGWKQRVDMVEVIGTRWATGDTAAPADIAFVPGANVKATIDQAKARPALGLADLTTGAGVSSGATGGALLQLQGAVQQAQDALSPFAGTLQVVGTILTGLVLAGVVLAVGGILWRTWARYREAQRADALDLHPINPDLANDNDPAPATEQAAA